MKPQPCHPMNDRGNEGTLGKGDGRLPPAVVMSESIKLCILLQSEAPYEEQVASTARFLLMLPNSTHYDIKGTTAQLMRNVVRQLGIKRPDSYGMPVPHDIRWEKGIRVLHALGHHDVPAIAKAAREHLKKFRNVRPLPGKDLNSSPMADGRSPASLPAAPSSATIQVRRAG